MTQYKIEIVSDSFIHSKGFTIKNPKRNRNDKKNVFTYSHPSPCLHPGYSHNSGLIIYFNFIQNYLYLWIKAHYYETSQYVTETTTEENTPGQDMNASTDLPLDETSSLDENTSSIPTPLTIEI